MSNQILIYIVAGSAIFSSALAIFVVFHRKAEHIEIVEHYKKEIEKLEEKTSKTLQKFEHEYSSTLGQVAKDTSVEIKKNIEETFFLRDQIQKLDSLLNKINSDLEKNYTFMNDEIKKRDAIIERKSKQIERLKENK